MKFLYCILIANYIRVLAQQENYDNTCPTEGVCPQIQFWLQDGQIQNLKSIDCSYEEYYFYKNSKHQISKSGNYVVYFTFFDYHSYDKILEIQSNNEESFNITMYRSKLNCEQFQSKQVNGSLKLIVADHQLRIQVTSNNFTIITFKWEYNHFFSFSEVFQQLGFFLLVALCLLIYLIIGRILDLLERIITFIYQKIRSRFQYKNPTTLNNEIPVVDLEVQELEICKTGDPAENENISNQEEQLN